jgi:phosphohistidine phosphatase
MDIYFLRHANAGEPMSNPAKDDQRPLDKEGIEQAHNVGRALVALKVKLDVIISSPLLRARQTAEIAAKELGQEDKLVTDDALHFHSTWEDFEQLLGRHKNKKAIMVVGHRPSQSEFLNQLVTGDPAGNIDFKKGTIAKVKVEEGKTATLKWIMPPKVVRALQAVASANSSRPKTFSK